MAVRDGIDAHFMWGNPVCAYSKTTAKTDGASLMKETLLSAEQQRKYDYFFLEAMRMKGKNEYDAAFGLLQHCLDINPTASSALYEISQYYMFLRQVPQGQVALEQAVAFAPDNYWYSQGLVSLYQQQMNWIRLRLCLRRW